MRVTILLALICLTSAAPAAAPPASKPASKPAPAADLKALIAQLSSDDWPTRQKAQDAIAAMGKDVAPQIEALAKASDTSPQVKLAAEAIIDQIAAADKTGPTLVSLHYSDAHPREVFADLAKQARTELPVWPENMWDRNMGFHQQNKTVTIDLDRQPFWLALREICKQTNMRVQNMGSDQAMTLMQGSEDSMSGPAYTHGPFMIVVNSCSAGQSISYGDAKERVNINLNLNLTMYVEPKVTVLARAWRPQLEVLTDDKDKSWIDKSQESRGSSREQLSTMHQRESSWSINVELKRPTDGGRVIKLIKGSCRVLVPSETETLVIDDILKAKNVKKTVGDRRVVIQSVTGKDGYYSVKLTIYNDKKMPQGGMGGQDSFNASAMKLVDAEGRALQRNGGGGGGSWEKQDFEYSFSAQGRGGKKKAEEPVKLMWEIPKETKELAVPFEFHDLKLPPPAP